MEHTKGKWIIKKNDFGSLDIAGVDRVCSVSFTTQEAMLANACLIAAAPIGYELAQEIIAMERDKRLDLHATKIHKLADEFIAKAEGK